MGFSFIITFSVKNVIVCMNLNELKTAYKPRQINRYIVGYIVAGVNYLAG